MQRAGQMRDRAGFYRRVVADDGYGNAVAAFADEPFLTCWVDVLDKLGSERLAAGRLEASRVATLRARSADETRAVQMDDMVRVRGADWNIRSVAAVGRNNEMIEFLIETGVAQ